MKDGGTRVGRLVCALIFVLLLGIPVSSRTPAHGNNDSNEPVVELGPGVTPPRVIHQVEPNPDSCTGGFRVSGVVLIGLIVTSQGLPRNVHVVRSLDKDLNKNAVQAVQQWRFESATKSGQPVAVRVTIEIRFQDL